jgi:uncharacterized protein
VPKLGPKAFEQCAGFLRIPNGDDPLDSSSVHPEAYPVVRRIVSATGLELAELIGNTKTLKSLKPTEFVDDKFGLPTVTDILAELDKPGRDPRPAFRTATFNDAVHTLNDLKVGMVLEGVVTNVAAFGAFIDIGVHCDGLAHVSQLSRNFVKDPREVVKPGDIVRAKVLEVDIPRKRISLTLRLDEETKPGGGGGQQRERGGQRGGGGGQRGGQQRGGGQQRRGQRQDAGGAMAEALRRAGYRPN